MDNLHTYRIDVHGRIDGEDLNAGSPLPVTVERTEANATRIQVRTDQSGLIGLLRHLHARGIHLFAVIILPLIPSPSPSPMNTSRGWEKGEG
ncbi:MAG: hypothetical protein JW929_02305 [Anaerolineales bacterium]|nr:hypothetical protein [Anaerolineales bacterium]